MSVLIKRRDAIDAVAKAYQYEADRITALQNVPTITEQEIRAKAIEKFAEAICDRATEESFLVTLPDGLRADVVTVDFIAELVAEIAEKMKEGAV